MKIAVTGAAGFIGSNIAEKLVAEKHEIVALDNFHTGKLENLKEIESEIKFSKIDAGEYFRNCDEDFDVINHQGVYSSSPMYKDNPLLTSKIIEEFITILEFARKKDIKKVIYSSTSSIYNGFEPPHHEEMTPYIKDFYTEGRYSMERIGKLYSKNYGIEVVGLRYFSVYGPHEKSKGKYANLISQFLWSMLKDEAPVVYGDGSQTRDFTYVDDIVRANILSLKKGIDGIFNVGTGRSTTINEMIEMLNSKLSKEIKAEYIENPIKNYVQKTRADVNKSKDVLGFEAQVDLSSGIEKLIEYYS